VVRRPICDSHISQKILIETSSSCQDASNTNYHRQSTEASDQFGLISDVRLTRDSEIIREDKEKPLVTVCQDDNSVSKSFVHLLKPKNDQDTQQKIDGNVCIYIFVPNHEPITILDFFSIIHQFKINFQNL